MAAGTPLVLISSGGVVELSRQLRPSAVSNSTVMTPSIGGILCGSRAPATTFAPRLCNSRTVASPMPRLPPVTRITLAEVEIDWERHDEPSMSEVTFYNGKRGLHTAFFRVTSAHNQASSHGQSRRASFP